MISFLPVNCDSKCVVFRLVSAGRINLNVSFKQIEVSFLKEVLVKQFYHCVNVVSAISTIVEQRIVLQVLGDRDDYRVFANCIHCIIRIPLI